MKIGKIILLAVLNLIFLAFFSQTQAGNIYFIEANPADGFHWPYYLYVPSSVSSDKMLVISNNTGFRDDDFNIHKASALDLVYWRKSWADVLQTPFLVPVFARYDDGYDGTIAPQYLKRGSLETAIPEYSRVDLQLLAMIEHAKAGQLSILGIDMGTKILMWGYSASGGFATRFTSLHPDKVLAVSFGGHGWPVAPVDTWESHDMPFPYGVGDFPILIGSSFDLTSFNNVSIYCYMGENDTNGWAMPWYIGENADAWAFYTWFINTFGPTASSLMADAQEIHESVGSPAQFVIYPGVGHEITEQMDADVLAFFLTAIAGDPYIQANGSDGRITVSPSTPVSITVSLDPGGHAGQNADWWVYAATPFGTYSYVYPAGWRPGLIRTIATPLFSLPSTKILNRTLPAGYYEITFAVDNNADNILNATWSDSVEVIVE